jgi:hypothetical protein
VDVWAARANTLRHGTRTKLQIEKNEKDENMKIFVAVGRVAEHRTACSVSTSSTEGHAHSPLSKR